MRKHFNLPELDESYLVELGLPWETILEYGMHWLLIYNHPVYAGYNAIEVCIAIKMETGYPRSPLDMAYFYPPLQRQDGKLINATTIQPIDGKKFQRWSRHRTAQNPWREGVDDISTHMSLINFWFEQEFIKYPNEIRA